MIFQQLDYLRVMQSMMHRFFIPAAIALAILAGCQADESSARPEGSIEITVVELEVCETFCFDDHFPSMASKKGFIQAIGPENGRLRLCFSADVSPDEIRNQCAELIRRESVSLVSLQRQQMKVAAQSRDGRDRIAKEVRHSMEKPKAPVQQFPSIFDLFRFLL